MNMNKRLLLHMSDHRFYAASLGQFESTAMDAESR